MAMDSESLVIEYKSLRTRNLLVRIASLPQEGNAAWLSMLDSFAASGCKPIISVDPLQSHQILPVLPLEYQLSVIVQEDSVFSFDMTFDFALGVSADVTTNLCSFISFCRMHCIPLHISGHPTLSDFQLPRLANALVDMQLEDSDSLDSGSLTAINPSPPASPAISPVQMSSNSSDFDLDPFFIFPPKNAGFSCTSFIPPPPLQSTDTPGSLTIVGAGPGTPSLLTVASINAIQSCSLLIVDRLVPADLLKYALTVQIVPWNDNPQSFDKCLRQMPYILHTRKVLGNAPLAQQEIEDWTASAIKLGHSVVRLKGGDPFVYGRGGEELLSARKIVVPGGETHGCDVKVIPGLSSSLVAPLMAGIPPTHRGVADQVLIATGRLEEDDKEVEWPIYAENRTTIVLMAMGRIQRVVAGMTESAGYPLDVPVAIVEKAGWGRDSGERVWKGVLSEAVKAVKELGLKAHATLIVGRVVHALVDVK
ncbi:tetrapyrrole methylase [Obelidium mucronatum]|nr:tetrapyrrole methylase [Obelidium mucronatum]